ncbi:hypothetical protein AM493_02930 [Flavobacterium akiainvivens]|uniref:Outer membrane protein beta-barrel domain-containing protein n=1 Tax=Flavobacterium akiainvivens TaxID=1202724 RepID=A0A0N0RQH4_9FLAO|nr:porin family protein [Flavobacterium akiainvivens]KOS05106.1 hypothetical protein AM493_02930 [Flavobacterium akiainvivens]SFQ51591.1 Outer membrane protein beta-barrel domain-containing protein [Flavobacterium akiainvivens]
MKKIALAATAFLFALGANAQSKGNIEFGVNTGVNFSTISSGEYWGSADTSTGFNVAASLDFYFSDRWSIKVKPTYDRKGWDGDYVTVDGNDYPTDYNVDYLTVPVMANWHFGSKRNWYLNFGPYAGFLLSAKDTRFDTDVKNALNSTDIGLAFGIGVKIPVSDKIKIFFEYEGQSGFSDAFKDNYTGNVYTSRNSLNVGLNFLLK